MVLSVLLALGAERSIAVFQLEDAIEARIVIGEVFLEIENGVLHGPFLYPWN